MSPFSRAANPKAGFTVLQTLILPRTLSSCRTPQTCRSAVSYLSSVSHSLRFQDASPSPHIQSSVVLFASIALPSRPIRFDKIPDRLPDWWDDEDDEDDEDNSDAGDDTTEGDKPYDDGSLASGGGGGGGGGDGSGGGRGGDGSGDDAGKGFFAAILAIYIRAINNAPIRTKALSTCLLALLGDFLAQRLTSGKEAFEWDRRRSFSVGIWGLCFMGPALHYWYGLLDRLFRGRFSVWQKLLSDQILFAPFFNGAFIAGVASLEGQSPKEVKEMLQSKLWPSMKANWTLWPAAQFINFALIPKTFQIVYVNCVALGWNAILTYISHDHPQEKLPIRN